MSGARFLTENELRIFKSTVVSGNTVDLIAAHRAIDMAIKGHKLAEALKKYATMNSVGFCDEKQEPGFEQDGGKIAIEALKLWEEAGEEKLS